MLLLFCDIIIFFPSSICPGNVKRYVGSQLVLSQKIVGNFISSRTQYLFFVNKKIFTIYL